MSADLVTVASESGKRVIWLRDPRGYAWLREGVVTSPKLERFGLTWCEIVGFVECCTDTQRRLGKAGRCTRVLYLNHRRGPKNLDGLCEFWPDEYRGVQVAVKSVRAGQFSKPPEGLFLVTAEMLAAAEQHRAEAFNHWKAWAENHGLETPGDLDAPQSIVPWYKKFLPKALVN